MIIDKNSSNTIEKKNERAKQHIGTKSKLTKY